MSDEIKINGLSSTIGQMVQKIAGIHDIVQESKADIKSLIRFQVKTEERLEQGNIKFDDHGKRIRENEKIYTKLEKFVSDKINKLKKLPRAGIVYSILVFGLMVISFLVVLAK